MATPAEIRKVIADMKQTQDFDETTELINSGFLDSFDVINLVLILETSFNVKINSDLIVPGNLETIPQIVGLLAKVQK